MRFITTLLSLVVAAAVSAAPDAVPYFTGTVSPTPQLAMYDNILPIDAAKVEFDFGENPCKAAPIIEKLLRKRLDKVSNPSAQTVKFVFTAADDPALNGVIPAHSFTPGVKEQYAVRVIGNTVYAAGSDNRGIFYAAASIIQQIDRANGVLKLRSIKDAPIWQKRYLTDYFLIRPEAMPEFFGLWKVNGYAWQMSNSWQDMSPNAKPEFGQYATVAEALTAYKEFYDASGGLMNLMLALRLYGHSANSKLDATDEESLLQLIEYCRYAAAHRVSHIMVRADDVVPQIKGKYQFVSEAEAAKFKSVGAAHGYIMKRLYEAVRPDYPELELSFCPGPYTIDSHRATQNPAREYLADLAAELPEDVAVVWTGRDVGTPVMTAMDTVTYRSLINQHKLFTWHNPDLIAGVLACPDNLDIYPEYNAETDSIFFANCEGTGKGRNRPGDLTYNAYLWNPVAYQGNETYLTQVKKLTNVADLPAYGQMLDDVRTIHSTEDRALKAKLIKEVEAVYPQFTGVELNWLPPYLKRQYANATCELPEISVPGGPLAIVPDGDLNEEVWTHAAKFKLYPVNGKTSDTTGYIYYNPVAETVYMAFVCQRSTPLPAGKTLARDADLSEYDYITLNFLPFEQRSCNISFDACGNFGEGFHWVLDWDPVWDLAVKNQGNSYTAELAIPIAAFKQATMPADATVSSGTQWGLQITRSNPDGGAKPEYLAPGTPEQTGDTNRFGKLIFQ